MQSIVLSLAVVALAFIAYGDVRQRRIPNALSLIIANLGWLRIGLAQDALGAGYTLLAAGAVFATTFVLFWRGAIGGGDAKLITAMALLIGYQDLVGFLLLMSLLGGVLAVAALARDKVGRRLASLLTAAQRPSVAEAGASGQQTSTVPYGVAIAAAGAIVLITAN